MIEPATTSKPELSRRKLIEREFEAMKRARQPYEQDWKTCAEYVLPSRPIFAIRNPRKASRFNPKVVDTTATQAVRIATSGLLNGMASPARPWFQLAVARSGSIERPDEQRWLEEFRDAILGVMERSNYYTQTGDQIQDELVFGTSPKMIFEDPDPSRMIRAQTFAVGSYFIAQDATGRVCGIGREYSLDVRAAADEFGLDSLSEPAQRAYRERAYDTVVAIAHLIHKNDRHIPDSPWSSDWRWHEAFWEVESTSTTRREQTPQWASSAEGGASGSEQGFLFEGGYHEFPVSVARWGRNHDDTYATDWPVADVLADIKMLSAMERVGLNGLNKLVNPPLTGGSTVDQTSVSQLAGAFTADSGPESTLRPIHDLRLPLEHLEAKLEKTRRRIEAGLMVPYFLGLQMDTRAQPKTAQEVREVVRQTMSVLAPVLERHADDVFDQDIARVAAILIRASLPYWEAGMDGIVPQPPETLKRESLRVAYISEIAAAQKLAGVDGLERHLAFVGVHSEIRPAVVDMVQWDEAVRRHADMMGLPHEITPDAQQVEAARAERQRMEQAQAAAEAAPGMATAAQKLSQTQIGQGSALDTLLDGVTA